MSKKKIFTYDEAFKSSLSYFGGDELAAKVWVSKYALKDSEGNFYECVPSDMHWRLAYEVARIESRYPNPLSAHDLFELFDQFKYIVPQGSPMTGIGNDFQVASLSNCFVIGVDGPADSYGAIIKIDEEQVQLMKRRGGVGHDLSHIRPAGSDVKNSALTSTGLVPFMERYSNSTREVAQGGRRGALMLSCSIKHPDVDSFIDAKLEDGKVTGANVSVKLTDDFMREVVSDGVFEQCFPVDSDSPVVTQKVVARTLWDKIIHNAWRSAEPGVLFWDTILRESLPDCYADLGFRTVSTNPCGEIPLCAYDSCRLLAINLYSYVVNPFTEDAYFDLDLFTTHVGYAQRIMDDIIDLEVEKIHGILAKIDSDPESEGVKRNERNLWLKILDRTTAGRRTGVGITAEGDMLAAMGLRYGTEEASAFSEEVHKALALAAYHASVDLAEERGAFPIYDFSRESDNPFLARLFNADPSLCEKMSVHGRRNIACLTVAPTGSTSLLTRTSSGIEPVFMPVYKRRRKVNPGDRLVRVDFVDEVGDSWEEYLVFHPKFLVWMEVNDIPIKDKFSDQELEDLVSRSPYYKATSNDVDWVQKVSMQGRIQKWVDHSISVTINLPSTASIELVSDLYLKAWQCGCKGCTVYRDGSRAGVMVAATGKSDKKVESVSVGVVKRPDVLPCDVVRFQNNRERWIAFIGLLDGRPYEIFTGLQDDEVGISLPKSISSGSIIRRVSVSGDRFYDFQFTNKSGYKTTVEGLSDRFNPEFYNYAKLISGVLRYGMPIEQVVRLVQGLELDSKTINTWKNGVERALKLYIPAGSKAEGLKCPSCGQESLVYAECCVKCTSCDFSKCG